MTATFVLLLHSYYGTSLLLLHVYFCYFCVTARLICMAATFGWLLHLYGFYICMIAATEEQVNKAKEVVKKLNFKFSSENFENPVLQNHWRNIEALALERDEPEELIDYTSELQMCTCSLSTISISLVHRSISNWR